MTRAAHPPGPPGTVDLAELPNLLEPLRRWAVEYGDVVRFVTTDGEECYSVCAPELADHVLRRNHRNYTRGYGVERVRLMLPGGLLVDDGERWLRHRTLAQPLFHRRTVAGLAELSHRQARAIRDEWIARVRTGAPLDVTAGTSQFALGCIVEALLGAQPPGGHPFLGLAGDLTRDLAFARRFRGLRQATGALLDRRAAAAAAEPDLLAMLLGARDAASEPPTRDELIDAVLTVLVAGHETTATALTWIWVLLAQHPEAEARLHRELDAARAGGAGDAELLALPYLGQVIDEALRLYPPVWLATRRAIAADRIGDFDIGAGAQVFIPLAVVLRHPRLWDHPDAFLPERFAADAPARHPLAYLPFGAGPRRCIGEHLAVLDLRCHVAHVASALAFRLSDPAAVDIDPQVNLRPRGRVTMTGRIRA